MTEMTIEITSGMAHVAAPAANAPTTAEQLAAKLGEVRAVDSPWAHSMAGDIAAMLADRLDLRLHLVGGLVDAEIGGSVGATAVLAVQQ